jgi:hypothetical protein
MLAERGEHGLGVVGGGAHLQRVIFGRGLEQWRGALLTFVTL